MIFIITHFGGGLPAVNEIHKHIVYILEYILFSLTKDHTIYQS